MPDRVSDVREGAVRARPLTEAQCAVVLAVAEYRAARGYGPTSEELAGLVGRSRTRVRQIVSVLLARGRLEVDRTPGGSAVIRSIRLPTTPEEERAPRGRRSPLG